MPRGSKTNSETVRRLWHTHFPNIALIQTGWFERYDYKRLCEAFKIAEENIRGGKQFAAHDEQNIGKYVVGILKNLPHRDDLLSVRVSIPRGYKINQRDQSRFRDKLEKSGDCSLFKGASTTGGYRKFWVNQRSVAAHIFAFFSEIGYLPAANALGGRNGLQVAHNCRNRSCCNPWHLRLTTKGVNLQERIYSGASTAPGEASNRDYGSTDGTCLPGVSRDLPDVTMDPYECGIII